MALRFCNLNKHIYTYGNRFVARLEQTKSAILPELLELTNDEESMVRLAGIETVVKILTLLDDGVYLVIVLLILSILSKNLVCLSTDPLLG